MGQTGSVPALNAPLNRQACAYIVCLLQVNPERKTNLKTLFLCLLILWIAIMPTAMAAPSLVPVTGRVLDMLTDKPIPGTLIGVYQSGRKEVRADSQGRFKVWASPGKRIIYYEGGHPYYHSDGSTYTTVNVPAKGLSGVTLSLWRVAFARGKVFMPSGMPLVGASVTMGGAYFTHAVTDSNGKFKIEVPQEEAKPGG